MGGSLWTMMAMRRARQTRISSTHTVDPMRFRVIIEATPNPDTADYDLAVASLRHLIKIFTFLLRCRAPGNRRHPNVDGAADESRMGFW